MTITKKQLITKELILQHVSEVDIVMGFWPAGRVLKFNRGISSPFRDDSSPSFIIGNKYGPITYKDLGDYNYRGNVWNLVRQLEGLQTYDQILRAVDQRFNLGYTSSKVEGKKVITWEKPTLEVKPPPIIQVTTRNFQADELRYWNDYYQDISDLKREHVYVPKEIYRNRQRIPNEIMTFCYYIPELDRWKLYRPYAPKKVKDLPPWLWKWDNSIGNLTHIENLNKLKGCKVGIVEKARKCRMVVRKATGIDSICSLQAEDPAAMTEEDMKYIDDNCEQKWALMDNDKKGKEMSWWLTKQRGYKHCNVPDHLKEHVGTDFSDMAHKTKGLGIDAVTEHFRKKGIIN